MAELHSNQIAFSAPSTAKASLAREQDYLSQPLAQLGGEMVKTAETVAAYEDNRLRTELEKVALEAQNELSNARELDANYDEIANEAVANWNKVFNSASPATRTRFLNSNPYAFEKYEMGVRANALEKRNNQIYNRSKLDIAQWSSQIVNAPADQQGAMLENKRIAIQNLGLPIEQTDDLLFDLQSNVDTYQFSWAVSNRQFDMARDLLRNGLPTKGAAQRAGMWQILQNAVEAESARKAAEEKAMQEAVEKGTDPTTVKLLMQHAQDLRLTDLQSAEKFEEDFYYGRPVVIWKADGSKEIINTSDIDALTRNKIYKQMVAARNASPKRDTTQLWADFMRLSNGLMDSDGNLLSADEDELVQQDLTPEQVDLAQTLYNNKPFFNSLSNKERLFITNVLRAGTPDLTQIDLNPETRLYTTGPMGLAVQKANPVINYAGLSRLYDSPANRIASALDPNQTMTGREADTVAAFAEGYEKSYSGEYEISHGTRSDALAALFAITATANNPIAMPEVGMSFVPRENYESSIRRYMKQMKQGGRYDFPADYGDLLTDFKNVYKMTTGQEWAYGAGSDQTNALNKYATLAYQYATKVDAGMKVDFSRQLPRDDAAKFDTKGKVYEEGAQLRPIDTQKQLDIARAYGAMKTEEQIANEEELAKRLQDIVERERTQPAMRKILEAQPQLEGKLTDKEVAEALKVFKQKI